MKLEYVSQEELQKQIKNIFGRYFPDEKYRLFFFGSRVKGDNSLRSDIDLGVEGENQLPPKLKLEIEDELQNLPILYKIDLVDFSKVSDGFKNKALKSAEFFN